MVLAGTEIKSLRAGKASFNDSYCYFDKGELYVKSIREKIFQTQMGWDTEKFKQKHFGKYLLRYSNDMKSMQNYLTKGIMGFAKDVCFLILGFLLLAVVNRNLSLYLLLVTSVIMGAIFFVSKVQKKLITNSRTKRSNLLALVTRSFQRHSSIKTNITEKESIDKFDRVSNELYTTNMANNRFESLLASLLPMLQFLMIGSLLVVMTSSYGTIRKRDALVFVLTTLMMMSPMKRVLKVPAIINRGKISLNKINDILEEKVDQNKSVEESSVIIMDKYKLK